jgi:lysine 6-dehydrogenase
MSVRYAVLGAGVQGAAVVADLALHGDAETILLADRDPESLHAAAHPLVQRHELDAADPEAVARLFEEVDVAISCLPYWMHPGLVDPALATGTCLIDLGGDSEEALATLERSDEAAAARVAVVTDAGLAPGLVNSLANLGLNALDAPDAVRLYCGGLPAHPRPPLGYHPVFSLEGLISEYRDVSFAIKNGDTVRLEPMTERETLMWDGLGELEAFVTSGGSGTAPWALAGKIDRYEYKTLRFPGHFETVRQLFRTLPDAEWEPALREAMAGPPDTDQVLLRVVVEGEHDGSPAVWTADSREWHDPVSGLTAMQRMTAFPASIVAIEMGRGHVPAGCRAFESAVAPELLLRELARRGIHVRVTAPAVRLSPQ